MQNVTDRYTVTIAREYGMILLSQWVLRYLGNPTHVALVPSATQTVIIRPVQHGDQFVYTITRYFFVAHQALNTLDLADGPWLVRLLPDCAVELVRQPRAEVLNQPHVDPAHERLWLTGAHVKRELGISDRAFRLYLEQDLIRATPLEQIAQPPKRIHGHTKYLVGRKELDRFVAIRREEYGPIE